MAKFNIAICIKKALLQDQYMNYDTLDWFKEGFIYMNKAESESNHKLTPEQHWVDLTVYT